MKFMSWLFVVSAFGLLCGCSQWDELRTREKGAVVGGLGGAAVGGELGGGGGALLGGAAGAGAGAYIGRDLEDE